MRGAGAGECFLHLRMEETGCQARAYVLPGERGGPKGDVGGCRDAINDQRWPESQFEMAHEKRSTRFCG